MIQILYISLFIDPSDMNLSFMAFIKNPLTVIEEGYTKSSDHTNELK